MNQDLEKAKQLLKEGGYNGETLVLMDPTDIPVLHGASLVTAQLLRDIGVKVEVQAMDWSTLTSRRAEKKSVADGGWNIFHTYTTGADASSPIANIGISGGCEEKLGLVGLVIKQLNNLEMISVEKQIRQNKNILLKNSKL